VFGEVLGATQWAAIALISLGILALATGAHDRRATWFAVGNACVIATYTLIDGKGVRASDAPVSYTLWFFAANGFVIGALGWLQRGADLRAYARRAWPRAMLGGALALGAYGIALWAMTRAPVALVAVLRETSVIFAALIGAIFLREKFTRRRLAATGAVLCGLIALRL
jgi:drug/metabolite transporter (DMT)-like permease